MTPSRRRILLAGGLGSAALAAPLAAVAAGVATPRIPLLTTYVAGAHHHDGPAAMPALAPGEVLVLRREPDNDYDPRSVAVWTTRGEKLGYVPRIHNQPVANLMDAGLPPEARVAGLGGRPARPEISVAITVALGA